MASNEGTRKRTLVEYAGTTIGQPASVRLRRDITASEYETMKAELEHERSLRAIDQKKFKQSQQRLERQVEFAVEDAKEAKRLLDEFRDESERHIEQLREARKDALVDLRTCQIQLEEERAVAAATATEEDPKVAVLEKELEAKTVENTGLMSQLNSARDELQRLIKREVEPPAPPDENERPGAASEAPSAVMRELNRVRIELAESERKNRQLLRAAEDWKETTKQLIHERERAQSSVDRARKLEEEMRSLVKAHETVKSEMKSWKTFGNLVASVMKKSDVHIPDPGVPPEIATFSRWLDQSQRKIEELQETIDDIHNRHDKAKNKISVLESTHRESEVTKKRLSQEVADLKRRAEASTNTAKSLKSQESVWKREIGSLRELVAMYDKLPLGGPQVESGSGNAQATVEVLKSSLGSSKEELKVMKAEVERLQKDLDTSFTEKEDMRKQHSTVLEKFAKLKEAVYAERAKAEKAEARACKAEALAGKGSFNPNETRVLHLKQNPVTEALKQEVEVLRRQIESLTGSKPKAESSELDPNKLHQRLKESFKEQISRFREGVYLMTGFKIDMIPGTDRPKFRVRSLYAEQEHGKWQMRSFRSIALSQDHCPKTNRLRVL